MEPIHKDLVAQQATTTKQLKQPTAPTPFAIDKHLQNLRANVTIIGWMSIISSVTILLCSALTMQWSKELMGHLIYVLRKSGDVERTRVLLRRAILTVSSSAYSLSAMNVLVNMLLLLGVAKLKYKLMLPWLAFHGFLYGFFAHVALYVTFSSLLLDFRIFVILFASFAVILMIFYKITYEVFYLCKTLQERDTLVHEQRVLSVEEGRNAYLILQSEA